MNVLDYVLLVLLLVMALLGLRRGFLQGVGRLVGLIIAFVVATHFALVLGQFLGHNNWGYFIAFVIIFGLTIKLVSLAFWILGKVFQIISVIPFFRSFDRILGFLLGLTEGIITLSAMTFFLAKFPVNEWLLEQMFGSVVVAVLLKISSVYMPLVPDTIKTIKSLM